MMGRDCDMNLRATDHPEFDAWRWNEYWVPLEAVIEFKRGVYEMALTELARYLPRINHHNRYLRAGMRPQHRGERNSGPMPLEHSGPVPFDQGSEPMPLEVATPPDGEQNS